MTKRTNIVKDCVKILFLASYLVRW